MSWGFKRSASYRERQLKAAAESIADHRAEGVHFDVQPIGPSAQRTILTDWEGAGRQCKHWLWEDIVRNHKRDGCWCFAIWSEDRLCAVVAARANKDHISVEYMEGDPRDDAILRGQRAAIALDLVLRYGEACGVDELRINPLNEALVRFYQTIADIEPFPDHEKPVYYRLEI